MTAAATITPSVDRDALDRLFDVSGLRVFLPGGYGALGESIAWGFAQRGARVTIAGPSGRKSECLAAKIRAEGGVARGRELDARSVEEIRSVVDSVAAEDGGITVTSTQHVAVWYRDEQRLYACRVTHVLEAQGDNFLIRSKTVELLNPESPQRSLIIYL